jgi:hypothetical protein
MLLHRIWKGFHSSGIGGATITISLVGDRVMVPAKQFRDAVSRIFLTELARDRLLFLGAQRRAHSSTIPRITPEKRMTEQIKSAVMKDCRYDRLSLGEGGVMAGESR